MAQLSLEEDFRTSSERGLPCRHFGNGLQTGGIQAGEEREGLLPPCPAAFAATSGPGCWALLVLCRVMAAAAAAAAAAAFRSL